MLHCRARLILVLLALCAGAARAFAAAPLVLERGQPGRLHLQRNRNDALGLGHRQHQQQQRVLAVEVRGGGDAKPTGIAQALWQKYLGQLDKRPVFTKAWTSIFISIAGDLLSQRLERTKGVPFVWDAQRAGIHVVVGMFVGAIMVHYWYNFLETVVAPPSKVKGKYDRVLRQLLVDQTIGSTVINGAFFVMHGVVSALVTGRVFPLDVLARSINSKLQQKMWPMLLKNWMLWPAANFINFSLVPPRLRVLFANFVAIFWNAYLAGSANR